MPANRPLLLIALLALLAPPACRTLKDFPADNTANADILRSFSANANASLRLQQTELASPLELRILIDSLILCSFQPLAGIEALRLAFTPDSVKALDRFNAQFAAGSYHDLQQQTSIDLNFRSLQTQLLTHLQNPDLQLPSLHTLPLDNNRSPRAQLQLSLTRFQRNVPIDTRFPIPAKYRQTSFANLLRPLLSPTPNGLSF